MVFHRSPLPCVHCDGHMLADTPRASPWCPWALLCRAPSGQRPDKPCSHLATWECALGQGGEPVRMFCMFALMAKAGDFCPKCSQTNTLQMPPADTTSFRKCSQTFMTDSPLTESGLLRAVGLSFYLLASSQILDKKYSEGLSLWKWR